MNCEQALNLISARIDREIESDERVLLDHHLEECPACQAAADAFALQDHELRRAFASRREAVAAWSHRIGSQLQAEGPTTSTRNRLPGPFRQRFLRVLGAAAAAAAVLMPLFLANWRGRSVSVQPSRKGGDAGFPQVGLTPRSLPPAPPVSRLAVGDTVQTRAGERRRLALPDGSILYVHQNTSLRLEKDRRLHLSEGTVFLDVAPRPPDSDGSTFLVQTPDREVKAFGTKLEVQTTPPGTEVLVTQGRVEVSDSRQPLAHKKPSLHSGQRLLPNSLEPTSAPRASHQLDWTRDLMAAAESPLVPGSQFDGGALIAVDALGQEAKLSLRKYHVDVHVEDGFARTTIDQTYFNHHPWRLEGTFYFPLPPDASLNRLAMYVDGVLMEGGMAEREYARQVYEQIVRSQRDPALLEWVDGSTFKMRVFPLEGRQEKRIVLSYVQRLPTLYGRTSYRFPAGHNLQLVDHWSFHARIKNGAGLTISSPTHPQLRTALVGNDLVLDVAERDARLDRDVALELVDPADAARPREVARFAQVNHEGASYLMLRYRPDLPGGRERQRRDWVFLFESSADRDPLLARTQIEIIRTLLNNVEHEDTFTIISAGTLVRSFADEAKQATPENVAAAIAFLEGTHLVGALDLGRALQAAEGLVKSCKNPWLVHVGSGLTSMGRRQEELVKLLPSGARYVGIGVGKRWGRDFMKQAAERTGGYFTQINPDEPISWRAFDLLATLETPRLLNVRVTAGDNPNRDNEDLRFLTFNGSVAQGEEVCAITRLDGQPPPQLVTVTGSVDGQPFRRTLPVQNVSAEAGYLPRSWAKLEIERLLAENPTGNLGKVVELSKAMYVMTPFTSLLVLENEEMYRTFKVDRGRKDHWALYPCPDKIPVVYEPDPTQPVDLRNAPKTAKPQANQVLQTILVRVPARFFYSPRQGNRDETIVTALQVYSGAYGIPASGRAELGRLGDLSDHQGGREEDARLGLPFLHLAAGDLPRVEIDRLTKNMEVLFERQDRFRSRSSGRGGREEALMAAAPSSFRVDNFDFFSRAERAYDTWGVLAFSPDGRRLSTDGVSNTIQIWDSAEKKREQFFWNEMREAGTPLVEKRSKSRIGDQFGFSMALSTPPILGRPLSQTLLLGNHESRQSVLRRGLMPSLDSGLPSLLYEPPAFTGDPRLFTDLIRYAPGLNTNWADIQAVLEAEAAPDLRTAPGQVDPAALQLIQRARQTDWQALTLPGGKDQPGITITFDGMGRYVYERTLPLGLREHVVCDGTTLWQLYPELGLGARRAVHRFNRAKLAELIPGMLPPAEDLARGADLECVAENVVAIVPQGAKNAKTTEGKAAPYVCLHLVFGKDGRLAERQVVEMPVNKVHFREVYDGHGGVRQLDAKGKELARTQQTLTPAPKPDLVPDTSRLVVLPLPFRTRSHVMQTLALNPNKPLDQEENACFIHVKEDEALELLAALLTERNEVEARLLVREFFQAQGDRRSGFYAVLSACGADVADEPAFHRLLEANPSDPLLRYLATYGSASYRLVQRTVPLPAARMIASPDTFLGRLAEFQDELFRWQPETNRWMAPFVRTRDVERSLDFIRRNRGNVLGWALLHRLTERTRHGDPRNKALAETWGLLAEGSQDAYVPRYEQALRSYYSGQQADAARFFRALYDETLREGFLPPLDYRFRDALRGGERGKDPWETLMLQTASDLVARKNRPAVVALALQCWQLGERPLSDNLLTLALDGPANPDERTEATLSAIAFLWHTNRLARADELVTRLLADEKLARQPGLWRLAGRLADRRDLPDRSMICLEKALDLEYQELPDVIDLESWRRDYGTLLGHYQRLAAASLVLHAPPPSDLAVRTIRAADRWRAHDPEATRACQTAATILQKLGFLDLAWEYWTTPAALQPEQWGSWQGLAQNLNRENQLDLANRAYAAASEREPENPLILWEWAENLRQGGRAGEGDVLLRRLAEDRGPEAFEAIRSQARWQLQQR
jgi:ferric-dicitrate binding protein FerR (iron transport regulator)